MAGFYPVAEEEGHIKLARAAKGTEAEGQTVLLPLLEPSEELAIGTLHAVLEQAGLARREFDALAPVEGAGDAR